MLAFGQKNIEMYCGVEWPLVCLGGCTLLTPGSFNVPAVSSLALAAWQFGFSQAIQAFAVHFGTLFDPRCVAVAFPSGLLKDAWQWPSPLRGSGLLKE